MTSIDIADRKWKQVDGEENRSFTMNAETSYLLCTRGFGVIYFVAGESEIKDFADELTKEYKKDYVTLEQLLGVEGGNYRWRYKFIESYSLETSLPTYVETIHELTQEDVDEINRILKKYKITTLDRMTHFIAQCAIESEKGIKPVETYDGDDIFKYFEGYDYILGNSGYGEGAKYRGAGAIQMTGKDAYEKFSIYMNDSKILEDGALYVAKEYFWESAGFYWSIYKNLNWECDNGESVEAITRIVMGDYDTTGRKKNSYEYYQKVFQDKNID